VFHFEDDFGAEIAELTTDPEWQNATCVIYIPAIGGEYDVDTGTYTGGSDPELIYRGRARAVGIRYHTNDSQASNPTALKGVRLQIVDRTLGRIPDQARVYFSDGGRNPQLTEYVFTINSDFNSSHVASYTFELTVDVEAAGNQPEFDEDGDYVAP
jgi:hypothetical protein